MAKRDDKKPGDDNEAFSAWILVPLAALMIPLFAVSDDQFLLQVALCSVLVIAALTGAVMVVMNSMHNQRMTEIAAKARLAESERDQLREANRVLDTNSTMRDLRSAVAEPLVPRVADEPELS